MRRVVLLDALGTLVAFAPPWPALRDGLAAHGVDVSLADAERALRAEIAYYRAHLHGARDAASLAALHTACAGVVGEELPAARDALGPALLQETMLASFAFRAFPEAAAELVALRERGATCVVCSNWDVSLHDVLRDTGLAPYLDGVVTSAELGISKPDPAPFRAALALAGDARPEEALHAGDSIAEDVAGARAAGVLPVLVDRDGSAAAHADALADVTVLPSLTGLARVGI
jgi:putative hydrolase of the HAD superfamily